MTEDSIRLLIYIHAISGGVSLLSGFIPILTKKGSLVHKMSGRIFVYSLLIATIVALFVSTRPGHENTFLFLIGVLSIYFVLSGWRSIHYKHPTFNFLFDIVLSSTLLLSSITMILYPVIVAGKIHILFTIFGALGMVFAIRDLSLFRNKAKLRDNWLSLHIGNIMGAYISSVTAFVVVNEILPTIYGWITPGILGGVYIAIWTRKVKNGA